MRTAFVVLALSALLGAPAVSQAEVIARVASPTEISAWGGVQVWSGPGGLQVRRAGRLTVLRGAGDPSGVDVGPGPDGKPRIVYVDSGRRNRLVIRRPDGSGRQVVPMTTGASMPTISGSQVVWIARDSTLRTSRIDGSQRRRIRDPLEESTVEDITDLDLSGSSLAVTGSYDTFEIGDEVGIVDVISGRRTAVSSVVSGESGRTLFGVSWARGRLFYYQTCINVTGRCSFASRYDPRTGQDVYVRSLNRLQGFAIDDDGIHAFVIPRTAADPVDWTATTVQRVKLVR